MIDIEPLEPRRVVGRDFPLFLAAGGEDGEALEVGLEVVAVRLRIEAVVPIDDAARAVFSDEEVDGGGAEVLGGLAGNGEEEVLR